MMYTLLISPMHPQGTLTHMAPEVLLEGIISKAADVYAFGVMLWELYTSGHAFKGVPRNLLAHQVGNAVCAGLVGPARTVHRGGSFSG